MFIIFLLVVFGISRSSEFNYNQNGLINTISALGSNDTPNVLTVANHIRRLLTSKDFIADPSTHSKVHFVSSSSEEADDQTTNKFRRVNEENNQTTNEPLLLNKSQIEADLSVVPRAVEGLRQAVILPEGAEMVEEEILTVESTSTQNDAPSSENEDIQLSPEHYIARPWWMQSKLQTSSEEEKDQGRRERQEIKLLNETNTKQNNSFDESLTQIANNMQLQIIANADNDQSTTIPPASKLLKEGKFFVTQPIQNKIHTVNTDEGNDENEYLNWERFLNEASSLNQLLKTENEHSQLEIDLLKDTLKVVVSGLMDGISQGKTHFESAEEEDNDRNKALRNKVETWYGNLGDETSRREHSFKNFALPRTGNIVLYKRNLQNLQSKLDTLTQARQLSRWRRQYSLLALPQALNYRRLLSYWWKQLRRQLPIKWNVRPLVEIGPGAFKTGTYEHPPNELAKNMQKLLALKKRQEHRNRDLNAGNENA